LFILTFSVKGVTISRPFIFGNVASPLPKAKANESDHTHKWTVQLRGIGDDDLSDIIHSVTFILHETYTNSRRGEYQNMGNFR
jgi:YEATS domain-containing protein 4